MVEIVSEPDIHSASQAKEYCQKLRKILRYLEVTDADMEKGSMRLEANTSWGLNMGYKVEVKNLNSFRFVEKAIEYDLKRQKELLEAGETPRQETRGWNEEKNITVSQRYKETSADYRYFPEPDIPPLEFDNAFIDEIRAKIPKLPEDIAEELKNDYGVRSEYALLLAADKNKGQRVLKLFNSLKDKGVSADKVAGMIINQKLKVEEIDAVKLIRQLEQKESDKVKGVVEVGVWIGEAIRTMPQAVADYKKGKTNALQALVGKVMQLSKGKADVKIAREFLEKELKS